MLRCLLLVMLLALSLAPAGCRKHQEAPVGQRLQVVTTLFPVYDFVRTVGGDKVQAQLLLPPGVEPHSFEPKPEDMVRIAKADLFVYTSPLMEPWAAKLLAGLDGGRRPVAVVAAEKVTYLPAGAGPHGHHDAAGEEHRHGAEGKDPHVWLDPANARQMVATITASLVARDPANGSFYAANAAAYDRRLADLDGRFKQGLANCGTREFLHGGHGAFGYLAARYGLQYQAAYALAADAEPTPGRLVALVRQLREHGLHHIFYEELLTPRVAETIAKETGATLLPLHGLHNLSRDELARGESYLSLMEQNLSNLRTGLACR
ncbi:MAG TPA: zinc ABC transporter substrate-binding protein [Geobacteraceae bacterium]